MTYCVAIKLNEGLVFCSDSRTNAGADRVNTYSKLYRFNLPNGQEIAMVTAGNLATSQAVAAQIERDIKEDAKFNIHKARYLSEIADYVGQISLDEQNKYSRKGQPSNFNAESTFILGGQLAGEDPQLYMVYPEGNHIATSDQYPFLQIGETKYGKPILDRIIRPETPFETAMRCALVSLDSTMRSNSTVGPPLELLFLPKAGTGLVTQYYRFEENDPYLVTLRQSWDANIRNAFNLLPPLSSVQFPR